jgi:hypothetical protein
MADVSRDIGTGRLLRKRTPHGRKHVLAAVRRRYLKPAPPLPGVPALALALKRISSPVARAQLLLPYVLRSDRAAGELVTTVVLPRLAMGGRLQKAELLSRLEALFENAGQRPWGSAMRTRWVEGLLSVLREVGALGRGPHREQLQRYAVRLEVLGFHLWGLFDRGLRGAALHESSFWRLLLLGPVEARGLIGLAADRGWWKFTSVGGTDEVVPVHGSLREWLTLGLG